MFPTLGFVDMYSLLIGVGALVAFLALELYFHVHHYSRMLCSLTEIIACLAVLFGWAFALLFQNLYNAIEEGSSYSWSWAVTFYGGLFGGSLVFILAYLFWIRKRYQNVLPVWANILPACLALGHGIGRLGCFCAGCCYGKETDSIWGVYFPVLGKKVFPIQLWEAIFLLILGTFLLLMALFRNWRWAFPTYALSYSVWRFAIEYLRDDHRGSFVPGLSPSQFWSLILFAVGVTVLVLFMRYQKKGLFARPVLAPEKKE